MITPELIAKHGITPEEYEMIRGILGRDPNITELGIFSVMWSEHCSYKNSRPELKKFPTTGEGILVKAGEENAGVIDIGDGYAVAFKIESHNHPSAVEPFQGAATGVGGIIRDIFTMGARPIFLLNSLRFGDIRGDSVQARTNRRLFEGVVSGIAHYGNCIGIPTVGGEVYFDNSYNGNPLVNALCLGVLRHDQIRRGHATGAGNPVFYVGAKTGRDGLAGAAFASRDLTEESKNDRPAVQVGDPFMEKILIEACLELFAHPDAVVGVQDMGAAGLTCSTCETASRADMGIEIDLAKVPQREKGMTPYETMLSESQERMLIIVRKGREQVVRDIFAKWDLDAAEIGMVTEDGIMRVRDHGEIVAEIPAKRLADEAPIYFREASEPTPAPNFVLPQVPPVLASEALLRLLAAPSIASKRWVYEQYDHMVRVGTVVVPGSDAAVTRIPIETPEGLKYKHLASSVDCNGHYCALDPYVGGKIAVAEAARNLACSGARPLGTTDNLNFGNPHKPENFWQLRRAVEGVAEACRHFNAPVTGGNVSLYNQSPAGAIDPTPTVAMVGIIDDPAHITTQYFKGAGDEIWLVGALGEGLGGSHYAAEICGRKEGPCPVIDLAAESAVHAVVLEAIRQGLVKSAHDCSEGGLAVALAECCISGPSATVGATVELPAPSASLEELLYNESQSRIVLSVPATAATALQEMAHRHAVPVRKLGMTGGDALEITAGTHKVQGNCAEMQDRWAWSIGRIMGSHT